MRWSCLLFSIFACAVISAPVLAQTRLEAENMKSLPKDAGVVSDARASGGKAVLLLGEKKNPLSDQIDCPLPAQRPGVYKLRLRMRVQDAYDIGRAWRAELVSGKQIIGFGVAHGYYFKGKQGYCDFDMPVIVDEPVQSPMIRMYWAFDGWYEPCSSSPKVTLDYVELMRIGELPSVRVLKVWPNKVHYARKEIGKTEVTLRNTTSRPVKTQLKVMLTHDLESPKNLVVKIIGIPALSAKTVSVPMNLSGYFQGAAEDYGYEVRAVALIGGKQVDSAREFFCVSDNPFSTHTSWGPFTGANDPYDPAKYFFDNRWVKKSKESKVSEEEAVDCALEARLDYVTCWEIGRGQNTFPGGCMDMAPKTDFWVDGDTGGTIGGKRARQLGVAELAKQGISCVTYNIPYSQGLVTMDLLTKNPEWFTCSPETQDFTDFGYDAGAFRKLRDFLDKYDLSKIPTNNGYMTPAPEPIKCPAYFGLNFTKPEVVDYVADQTIASMKMFGFVGVRWDCGGLNTGVLQGNWRPYLDFYGKPLCNSPEEMVKQTVANLRRYKSRVKEHYPDFCSGYNYGSVEETRKYPEVTKELCRDGGWLLDEVSYTYHTVQSAYRFWDKYYEAMTDQGGYVASMGGHYNPWAPTRYGTPYPADRLYHTVFQLAGHGHPQIYFRDSKFPTGDTAQFSVRFGRYLFSTDMLRVKDPKKILKVDSRTPVWWDKSVSRSISRSRETLVVHLLNPPVSKALLDDKTSALPSPVKGVSVTVKVPRGKKVVKAWVLTAESWKTGVPPETRAVPVKVARKGNSARAVVPELLVWKTMVFRFE